MPIIQYLVCVGLLLTSLLYAWSEYLEPGGAPPRPQPAAAGITQTAAPQVRQPTFAPPVAQVELAQPATASSAPSEVRQPAKATKTTRRQGRKSTRVAGRPRGFFAAAPMHG